MERPGQQKNSERSYQHYNFTDICLNKKTKKFKLLSSEKMQVLSKVEIIRNNCGVKFKYMSEALQMMQKEKYEDEIGTPAKYKDDINKIFINIIKYL